MTPSSKTKQRKKNIIVSFFQNAYSKTALYLLVHRIRIPKVTKIQANLSEELKSKLQRKILIHQIKKQRYSLQVGSLWLRQLHGALLRFSSKYRVYFSVSFKIVMAIVLLIVPFAIFLLAYGFLPVPSRIPQTEIIKKLDRSTKYRTDWPYGDGSTQVAIGRYPRRLENHWGFLVTEGAPTKIPKLKTVSVEFPKKNYLRIEIYLLPTENTIKHCKIELRNEHNKLLASTALQTTLKSESSGFRGWLWEWWQKFIPYMSEDYRPPQRFQIVTDTPPEFIHAYSTSFTSISEQQQDKCIYLITDLAFEYKVKQALPRRGVVFLQVDGLTANKDDFDKWLPNLNTFKNKNFSFENHISTGNTTLTGTLPLLSSFNYNRIKQNTQDVSSLMNEARKLGYRSVAVGKLQDINNFEFKNKTPLKLQETIVIENPQYETRQITEFSKEWLQSYGKVPFFLYLNYGTLSYPFLPSFKFLKVTEFLSTPISLIGKKLLWEAALQTFDQEFEHLQDALQKLGINEEVDIFVSSAYGTPMTPLHFWFNKKNKKQLLGAPVRPQNTLFKDDIAVPFFGQIAGLKQPLKIRNGTSSHLDIMPTLMGMMSGTSIGKQEWQGFNLWPFLVQAQPEKIEQLLQKRNWLPLEGEYSNGIVYSQNRVTFKLVHQLEEQSVKLYLTQWPWSKNFRFAKDTDLFSKYFDNGTESFGSALEKDKEELLHYAYEKYFAPQKHGL